MQPKDIILVRIDDPFVERPTLFKGRMPTRGAPLGRTSAKLDV